MLEDLNSTNGTFLNDERILEPMELRDGDTVSIGDVKFTLPRSRYHRGGMPLPEWSSTWTPAPGWCGSIGAW